MTNQNNMLSTNVTSIPGLLVFDLPLHVDNRGWFKEAWQREKMLAAGMPDFRPVQNNVSFNSTAGATRGIHAEPWDKLVSVAAGRALGVWVDLRSGSSFGRVYKRELDPSFAVFVPKGVGNAFQTLEANTVYSYLVNDQYSSDVEYTTVNVADPDIAIDWPISLDRAELSNKDRNSPRLREITPIAPPKTLVVGASGQLGRALQQAYARDPHVEFADRTSFDLTGTNLRSNRPWRNYSTIINAAAYTSVDLAEGHEGRMMSWATNVTGVAALARIATENNLTLIHVSSDYVFDGYSDTPYRENDHVCPLGVYGQTKAAGDLIVTSVPKHYILRTSWVIGEGHNFVRTMLSLAERGANPSVIDDQFGRLTFANELACAIRHLAGKNAPYGLYNMTGAGRTTTWAEVARQVFRQTGHDPARIKSVSTVEYRASTPNYVAPRPRNSQLDLRKIIDTGFEPQDAGDSLMKYIDRAHVDL